MPVRPCENKKYCHSDTGHNEGANFWAIIRHTGAGRYLVDLQYAEDTGLRGCVGTERRAKRIVMLAKVGLIGIERIDSGLRRNDAIFGFCTATLRRYDKFWVDRDSFGLSPE